MFETDVQPVITEYLAGAIRVQDFLMDSRPWPNYSSDYGPMVELMRQVCRESRCIEIRDRVLR